MNSKEIEKNLDLLNEELSKRNISISLLVVGGAAIVTRIKSRKSTQDVDAVILAQTAQVYRGVKQAIQHVAIAHNLPQEWMNDDVTIITDQVIKPLFPYLWKEWRNLKVYFPEHEYLMALKLFAARAQDEPDIRALAKTLKITTQLQAWDVVKFYIPQKQQDMRIIQITEMIGRCFRA